MITQEDLFHLMPDLQFCRWCKEDVPISFITNTRATRDAPRMRNDVRVVVACDANPAIHRWLWTQQMDQLGVRRGR